jgi:hypothetical protein
LWTSTYYLLGLRYSEAVAHQLLEGIHEMGESVTYQATIARGRREALKKIILLLGHRLLGKPNAQVRAALDSITDLEQLEQLSVQLLDAPSWQHLLALPSGPRRRPKETR